MARGSSTAIVGGGTNWGSLGQGLGSLLGAAVTQYQDQQTAQGVGQIWQDPNVPDDQKLIQSIRRFGDKGGQMGLNILKSREFAQQMQLQAAQTEEQKALSEYHRAQIPFLGQPKPLDPVTAALKRQETATSAASAAHLGAETEAIPAATAEKQAQTGAARARAVAEEQLTQQRELDLHARRKALHDIDPENYPDPGPAPTIPGPTIEPPPPSTKAAPVASPVARALEQPQAPAPAAAALAPGVSAPSAPAPAPGAAATGPTADALTPPAGTQPGRPAPRHAMDATLDTLPGLTDTEKAAARQIYNGVLVGGGKPDAAYKTAESYARAQSQASATPIALAKEASDAAVGATSAVRFMDTFEKAPQKIGLLSGATIKAWWEGKGGSSGDAELLQMYDAGLLQAADTARQGGGFWSQGRFALAKDTTATIADSPLRAIINMDQTADRRLAQLRSLKMSQPGRPLKDVDDAIASWEQVKQRTATYQTYTTAKGGTVLLHGGNVLDPGSFKTLISADRAYKIKGSSDTVLGRDIALKAAERAMDPLEMARMIGIGLR